MAGCLKIESAKNYPAWSRLRSATQIICAILQSGGKVNPEFLIINRSRAFLNGANRGIIRSATRL